MRRERGQLAIGLAMAFTAVCAIFGLIFNSAMMTREKMTLQQTTDFAALVAADVQRRNLNYVNDINERIETLYERYLPFVQQLYAVPGTECDVFEAAATILSATTQDFSSQDCEDMGDTINDALRSQAANFYNLARDGEAQNAANVISTAGQIAHERAMEVFYVEKWLPHGVRRILAKLLGQNPSPAAIRDVFEPGLNEILRVTDTKDFPLFFFQSEQRDFVVQNYYYWKMEIFTPNYICLCLGSPAEFYSYGAKAKVVRDNALNYPTNFLLSATYAPPNTFVDKRFAYNLRKQDARFGSSEIRDEEQRPLRLFNVTNKLTGEKKTVIQTTALAKPWGGEFPKGGPNPIVPQLPGLYDVGNLGKDFKGAKLIGIADYKRELEGFRMPLEADLPTGERLVLEDFLH